MFKDEVNNDASLAVPERTAELHCLIERVGPPETRAIGGDNVFDILNAQITFYLVPLVVQKIHSSHSLT